MNTRATPPRLPYAAGASVPPSSDVAAGAPVLSTARTVAPSAPHKSGVRSGIRPQRAYLSPTDSATAKQPHHPPNHSGALHPYSLRSALPCQQGPAAFIAGCALWSLPVVGSTGHTTAGGLSVWRAVAPDGRNSPPHLQPRWHGSAPLQSLWLRTALIREATARGCFMARYAALYFRRLSFSRSPECPHPVLRSPLPLRLSPYFPSWGHRAPGDGWRHFICLEAPYFAPYGAWATLRPSRQGPRPVAPASRGPRPCSFTPLPLVAPRHGGRGYGRAVAGLRPRFFVG